MSNHQVWLDITWKGLWTAMCARVSVLLTLLLAPLLSHPLGSDQHHLCSENRLSSQEAPHLHCFLMSVKRLSEPHIWGLPVLLVHRLFRSSETTWSSCGSKYSYEHPSFGCVPHAKDRADVDAWIWPQAKGVVALETNAC